MNQFKTSSGYVFMLFHAGDVGIVKTKCDAPLNAKVKVLEFHDISRQIIVEDLATSKKYTINCANLEPEWVPLTSDQAIVPLSPAPLESGPPPVGQVPVTDPEA